MTHIIAKPLKRFFSHYLPVRKGLAANTILAYRDAIKLLLCYASDILKKSVDELCVEDIDESLVLGFLDHIENTRGCSARTRNARLAAYPFPVQFHCPGGTLSVAPLPDDPYYPY